MTTGSQIVTDFISAFGRVPALSVVRSGVSQNVFEVTGSPECLLYVKGRGEAPYRWGVTANVVERLKRQKQRWFTVLLYETKETGYLLSSADVLHYIKNVWPLAGDGDYKPASGTYLACNAPFTSFNEFVRTLRAQVS
jgi:hypothetical protein